MAGGPWQFWIDRGGTFTDIVAQCPDGALVTEKLLSDNPDCYDDAAVAGMRRLLGLSESDVFPADAVGAIKMGTTVATNALLERAGEPTLLLITRGFADALYIAQQNRPRLFDLKIERPPPLYARVAEADERVASDGTVLRPLDQSACRQVLQEAYDGGLRAVAIAFVHGYRSTDHEARAAEIAREIGFSQITLSHEAAPLIKLVGRGQTAVADAYLSPVLTQHVRRVRDAVAGAPLYFMQSSGGLVAAERFRGKDAILSGPAGGAVGAVETAKAAGFERVIAFDMGGTSTDVSHYRGAYERSFETEVAGAKLKVPMMSVHTVAAGGGSVCRFDGERFRVGPTSAGAHPGPVCYRNDGPLTVTDCNLLLGKIRPEHFPAVFGPQGNAPLDADAVQQAFAKLADEIAQGGGGERAPEAIAEGFLTVAVEHMARAIKSITVERGHDVTGYALAVFGGAGGQHGCLVADALGMETVLVHPMAGVLSALGMGLADLREIRERAVEKPLSPDSAVELEATLDALSQDAFAALADQGAAQEDCRISRRIHAKYEGTDTALLIAYEDADQAREAFEAEHARSFGFADPDRAVLVDAASVEAVSAGGRAGLDTAYCESGDHEPLDRRAMFSGGEWQTAPTYERTDLAVGRPLEGPALILEGTATTVVEAGWRAERSERGDLVMTRSTPRPSPEIEAAAPDPVLLEVFNNLFMSVAEQMGAVLEKTAHSVNMKERLDFSCAVFDRNGGLIANAPHMPVHLGSMGESVKAVIETLGADLAPGDGVMMNDPFNGGTHLPDITAVTPVFLESEARPTFFVASRGHHADIGGITPGSMPPNSCTIGEEGVLVEPIKIVEDGRFCEETVRGLLTKADYPARNPDQNVADLKAQLAANRKGVAEVERLVDDFGADTVAAYMAHVKANAAQSVGRVVDVLNDGQYVYRMDCGAVIKVAVRVDKRARRATVDFTGTSLMHEGNFNAPKAIARAAVLYVFRCLAGEEIPLNDGCLDPIDIVFPEGSLLSPAPPAAVVAGNVETSQAITNALFLALGKLAAAQGTMNNLTFGNARHQYYETLCGGAGAGDGFDGEPAVHTHMTNSRLTDPEVLENRYPVRVERFAIRRGSGGAGRHKGGDGVLRELVFEEAMSVQMLSGHRLIPPPGLEGGAPGTAGRTYVIRADGGQDELNAADGRELEVGDRLIIETPGGGGYGPP